MEKNDIDIIGKKFFSWTVISETEKKRACGSLLYTCKCTCGKECEKTLREMSCGSSKGCIKCHNLHMNKIRLEKNKVKYVGTKIGVWEIVGHTYKRNISQFIGKCPCGNLRTKPLSAFKKFDGCRNCCTRKCNKEGLRKHNISSAENKIGKIIGSFELLKIDCVKNHMVHFLCKCLFCKKKTVIPNGIIPYRESCGCLREKHKARGSNHFLAKFNEIEVGAIRELHASGYYSQTELAKNFNTTVSTINSIVKNKSWRHVKA